MCLVNPALWKLAKWKGGGYIGWPIYIQSHQHRLKLDVTRQVGQLQQNWCYCFTDSIKAGGNTCANLTMTCQNRQYFESITWVVPQFFP